jgi:hypothetical protein
MASSAALWPDSRPEAQPTLAVNTRRTILAGDAMNPIESRAAPHEPWYKYGVAVLLLEIAIAVAVSGYSLYMTFNGLGGFPGKH